MDRLFDQQIKKAMEGYQAPYDEQSWDYLEMRLQQEGLVPDAEPIDEMAKEALSKLDAPYNPSTWHILSEKLEQLEYNRKLISIKFIEAALILFAFLTVARYTTNNQNTPAHTDTTAQVMQHDQSGGAEIAGTSGIQENERQSGAVEGDEVFQIPNVNEPSTNIRSQSQVLEPLGPVAYELSVPTQPIDAMASLGEKQMKEFDLLTNEISQLEVSRDLRVGGADYTTYTLPALSWPGDHKLQTKIGFYAQGNIHRVLTPLYNSNTINETVAIGPGVGFQTAVHIGNAGFDFGIVYEKLTFQGISDKNLIHKAAIPVHLKLIPLSVESISMYVKGGGSLHGVLNARYEEPAYTASTRSNFLNKKEEFNDGLLNEGLADNNVYVTANIGIGIEKAVYRDIFFFGEALYQRQILGQGIGDASRNTFKTLSLNLGINYTIR